ncbi:hypothetical protein NLJ89_g1888 [Agrocybe chaxingu]|uniref:F-box domain-containing protein n=1 Tax=Agrocybe chaxingu TaxID=84603 RepID=A0A9W8MZ59_9AGAR|nr:hypothetical protein NLJ89_g1888 [Agrocybe chaxingu]
MVQDAGKLLDRFKAHLGTNYAPTEVEVAELKRILHEPDAQIRALDEQIGQKEAELEELRKRREALVHSTRGPRALLSPIRRIPQDILQEILLACLPGERYPTMSADEPPMLLTRISSHWRQVAHRTPRLWDAIHIPAPSTALFIDDPVSDTEAMANITDKRIGAVNAWLSRSGACPLSISLWERHSAHDHTYFVRFLTECLIPVCFRWKDVTFASSEKGLNPVKHLTKAQTPLLDSLHLSLTNSALLSIASPNASWADFGILGSQRLTSLSMCSPDVPWKAIRWEQLTTFSLNRETMHWNEIGYCSIEDLKSALREARALISCTLQIRIRLEWDDISNPLDTGELPIELPSLQNLTIDDYEGISVLPFLRTPCLYSLSYASILSIPRISHSPSLLRYLQLNPGVDIHEFSTDDSSLSIEHLVPCLELLPALRVLHIIPRPPIMMLRNSVKPLDDELLTLLTPSESPLGARQTLCPNIEDVEFAHETNMSEAAVVNWIRKKQTSEDIRVKKLRNVKLAFAKKKPKGRDITADLQSYVDAGLKVELKYRPVNYRDLTSLYEGLPSGLARR